MKKIQKKRLNIIIKRHELWLASDGKEGKRANLEGTDLSYADLSNADLSYAVLRWTKLDKANLEGVIGLK